MLLIRKKIMQNAVYFLIKCDLVIREYFKRFIYFFPKSLILSPLKNVFLIKWQETLQNIPFNDVLVNS